MLQQTQDITSFEDLDDFIRVYPLDKNVSPNQGLSFIHIFMTPIEVFSINVDKKMDLIYVIKCGVGIFPTLVEIEVQ